MLVKTYGSAVHGIKATTITIEVSASQGINFFLVGLPDSAVKESQQRIAAAFENNKLKWPKSRIVINMAPADIRKEGSAYDLPLAVGILAATGHVNPNLLSELVIMGELSLDGTVQPIKECYPLPFRRARRALRGLLCPERMLVSAVVNNLEVYAVDNLKQVMAFLNGDEQIEPTTVNTRDEFFSHANSTR